MTTIAAVRTGVRPHRGAIITGILLLWLVGFTVLRGRDTLSLGAADVTSLHTQLNELNDAVGANRNSNPLFLYFFNEIRLVIEQLTNFVSALVSQPAFGRPVPLIGWLGVVALLGYGSWALGNLKVGLLAVAGFTFMGLQGLWQESMDTFALTLSAVLVSLLVGIPLGIWAGVSDRVNRVVTPVLDFMQTMPTFVYLAPLTLVFLIGPASAVIATLIYAAPPVIRIAAHGIRQTPKETLEAAQSLGTTRFQLLRQVMLPMAKRTIVIGINQTIMAALSMVTIAALIDAPGLGRVVLRSLQSLDVGAAFNAGLSIVVMAIVFDRVTTAASVRVERSRRSTSRFPASVRKVALLVGGAGAVVCLYLSYTFVWAAEFPTDLDLGAPINRFVTGVTDWTQVHLSAVTSDFKELVTNHVLNPFQTLLTDSPWWLLFAVLVALAAVAGSMRTALVTALCLALIVGTGLWFDAMSTLAATLLATVAVMVLGLVFGVWMGRSPKVDRVIRPVLDAAQTMPSFVYLVPFVALFAASRFTGIAAGVVYAAPVAIKIIADGIAAVSPTTMEAATSAGSSTWQLITKVQLPMSLRTIALAMNQGLIYVLSMVVVGGLVGGGALGYDVVAGFRQNALFGKGLAAGLAIVLLGIMLDRLTQSVARRAQATTDHVRH
ncbi:proline/glycine betaine ABC transporter permease [Terrabacter sp. MAHUQ-38]|uniref:ABC transporter permease n=1 Tax=unclassified Terrabacter TaxID=2630222 RepID=UPI00165D33B1|nr:ABC transporter permease subunit [Terrabacter sp. MAHUQ-38]MBC9821118.1 ABC transporter permease subunit [Terrabacter sp. MAHUQ-38]